MSIKEWENVRPLYKKVKGWRASTADIRRYSQLPVRARDYIKIIEDYLRVRVELISVGSLRKAVIKR